MSDPVAQTRTSPSIKAHTITAPGQLRVISREGNVQPYDESRIRVALTTAMLSVMEADQAESSASIHDKVQRFTHNITKTLLARADIVNTVHIEEVQNLAELELMRAGEREVATAYILYREQQRLKREKAKRKAKNSTHLQVTLADGTIVPLNMVKLEHEVATACEDLTNVSEQTIITGTLKNLFDQAPVEEINKALIMTSRTLIEKEPNYSSVTARLLLNSLRKEALSFLEVADKASFTEMNKLYPRYFKRYIEKGIGLGILNPALKDDFDLEKITAAIKPERDRNFTYLSLQTLYDRYFIHHKETRYELPQAFYMRVAMGLSLKEKEKEKSAIEFYELLSSFDFMSSTPTLFNSGTHRPQLSSCFLTTVPDDLDAIYGAIKDNALLSKFSGGLGNDWTPVRAMGSRIKGTNGKSQGVVPFLNVANASTVAVNQGGKRKGAACAYLECWHLDIEDFLELRKNSGDERRRTHDMNTATWVPDLFMKRVLEKSDWTLFSPDETPDLHETYGKEFETKYLEYENKAASGEIDNYRTIKASDLWRKMLSMLFETGHPWLTFKDPCNLRSPQQHIGTIHSSNLCTEITLNTNKDEIAVCNLGSVNLPAHIREGKLDTKKLKHTVHTAIRMLDNVIDINYYSVPQAKNSNFKHRPIGLGLMGFQDALYCQDIAYASDEAITFADISMEHISYYAIEASNNLAKERGRYETYEGSLWSQGILPIDSIKILVDNRGSEYIDQDTSSTCDWDTLRQSIKTHGMRNSNVMAIAPTATISNICGVAQSIEPTYQNLYVKSNLSGEFTVINPHLVEKLKSLNLWDEVMVNDLKYYDGKLENIDRVPEEIKKVYLTAFEISPKWLIECASRRQKWIDQAQSLNLYMAQPSGKKLNNLYQFAWKKGLKTTYYLRSLGATNTEKSTITRGTLNAVNMENAPKACSIEDPDCEACQ
jgi:ribonucleoside-diphosphate reductase alpha chain